MSCALILSWLVPAAVAAPPVPPVDFECAHAKQAVRAFLRAPDAPTSPASLDDTDVQHYALDIEVDPSAHWLGGANAITARSTVDGLDAFEFRLDDLFTIDGVTFDGVPAAWTRLDASTVSVALDPPVPLDAEFTVEVSYAGNPDGGGFGSIVYRTRGGAPEVWTLSEPWFAHTWWPTKDDNTDKSTADLWFTVPSSLRVASNGTLMGVDDMGGGLSRYRWKTDYQTADYLYCFGITNYETFGTTWEYGATSMPLEFYIYPEDNTPSNRAGWLENTDMLTVFSDHYGLYPFVAEKYGMCEVGFGGGMEHQTMTSQGGFWESTTAHELAHQWFGDMITCATWHDIWLNEGFATWSEAVWFGNKPGATEQGYHDRMEVRRPHSVNDSVYVYDATDVGRIFSTDFTYRKAAWALHMLRHVVTDDVWWNAIAAYRDALEFSSATTEDFRAIVEGVAAQDLGWYFDEWIYDVGAPSYRWAWSAHEVNGRFFVEVFIKQTQSASYPIFTMPLDMAVNGDDVHVVWNDEQQEHLLFEVSAPATTVAFDPDVWVLDTGRTTIGFTDGPPKVIDAFPAPGGTWRAGVDAAVTITFHKDVVADAGQFSIVGDAGGPASFDFAYDADAQTVSLALDGALPDAYTLTVADAVVDVASGQALDGEVAELALPSGDGLAGGAAVIPFTVLAGGDVDGDGVVDTSDLLAILAAWGPCAGCAEDLDGDGAVGVSDLLLVLGTWTP